MKRVVCIIMIFAAITVAANAQFFVEGSVSAGYNAGRSLFYTVFDTPTNIFFHASPLAGYQLNEKIGVGTKASIVRVKEKIMRIDPNTGNEVELIRRAPEWSLAIFCRYKLLGSKKISFLVESSVYVSENKLIDKSIASIYKANETVSTIGINMLPLVTYDLSDKFSIIAAGDLLSLDLSSKTEKNKNNGFVIKRNHFGFSGKSTMFKYLPDIRIGFVYHFNKSSK